MGVLTGFAYQTDGTVMGTYDNGSNLPLYRVPLALFKNPEGLERLGENILGVSLNSGEPVLTMAQEGGAGKIRGSSVEGSNVDIVEEFVNLIRGQRGYQANARIVTTSVPPKGPAAASAWKEGCRPACGRAKRSVLAIWASVSPRAPA